MKREKINERKIDFDGIEFTQSIMKITMEIDELNKIKSILNINTYDLRRNHKSKILHYIMEKFNYSDIYNDYGIFYSIIGDEVSFTYDALLKENFSETDFSVMQKSVRLVSIY